MQDLGPRTARKLADGGRDGELGSRPQYEVIDALERARMASLEAACGWDGGG